ncbi:hypothetical protein J6590_072238 [Homalodisca vitripennis]|nr:hypothetical protein J6590_072238 [Homalodisca vitripennis]
MGMSVGNVPFQSLVIRRECEDLLQIKQRPGMNERQWKVLVEDSMTATSGKCPEIAARGQSRGLQAGNLSQSAITVTHQQSARTGVVETVFARA